MKIVRAAEVKMVPASHEDSNSPGVLKRVLFRLGDLTDGRVQMINWAFLPRGRSFRAHYHEDMQEVFILIDGEARMTVDNEHTEIRKGDGIAVPARCVHTMENVGRKDVEYIVVGIATGTRGETIVV